MIYWAPLKSIILNFMTKRKKRSGHTRLFMSIIASCLAGPYNSFTHRKPSMEPCRIPLRPLETCTQTPIVCKDPGSTHLRYKVCHHSFNIPNSWTCLHSFSYRVENSFGFSLTLLATYLLNCLNKLLVQVWKASWAWV